MFVACSHGLLDWTVDCGAKMVNPFIGTDHAGNTYPGAQVPFGMVQLSPDNGLPGWDRISGYFYQDSTISGFSHTHLSGTSVGDLYDISFMPVTLPYKESKPPLGIYSSFLHSEEAAGAGYYQVMLKDYNIRVELTATQRCGIQRYTFPKANAAVFLNLRKSMNRDETVDTYIDVVDSQTIRGYRISNGWARDQHVYFYTRFSRPFDAVKLDTLPIIKQDIRIGTSTIARFDFHTEEGEQVVVSTALSGVGMDGAMRNLKNEVPDDNFNEYLLDAHAAWDDELGKIEVHSDDYHEKVKFYTALYHAMLAPTIYSDVDGMYRGADGITHHAYGWINYSTFALWDTYRAVHPLFTLIEPERTNDMVKSMVAFYEQSGRLPVWSLYGSETDRMVGYHSVSVIVDAYLKRIGNFEPAEAMEACLATANSNWYRGIGEYKKYGYVPCDIPDHYHRENGSLSKTLAYAFDDYCIARMAEKMGRKTIAEEFYQRSQNYRNLYNSATGFFHPRDSKGNFVEKFHPDEYSPYICESNAWESLWLVYHDIDGLIELLGGKQRCIQKLDSLFTYNPSQSSALLLANTGIMGQYVHGNAPDYHVMYLYNKVGQPWKVQEYVAKAMREFYHDAPSGLTGNDDCGQMSAWYVFGAMGFYPLNPVSGQYEIGTPLFPQVDIHLPNDKTFSVIAHNVSEENFYIQSVKLNGEPLHQSYITHRQIMEGGKLEFEMGNRPGKVWY
ncbi:MAG: GH92 family glycosyl hydrolase [Mediterranea sp.]|jgi:predicted alpha-1,2-mannosidase|nr:GH92 family glycosyl hydrolase [Mediterranea sp.]